MTFGQFPTIWTFLEAVYLNICRKKHFLTSLKLGVTTDYVIVTKYGDIAL